MTDTQLALIDTPATPKLTGRQQAVLDAITASGPDGLEASEIGALIHERNGKHSHDDRCRWCPATGTEILKALRAKGLVKYRRKIGAWTLTKVQPVCDEHGLLPGQTSEIPY